MSRPIEITPSLRGKDAQRFLRILQSPKPDKVPVFDVDKMVKQAQEFIKQQTSQS